MEWRSAAQLWACTTELDEQASAWPCLDVASTCSARRAMPLPLVQTWRGEPVAASSGHWGAQPPGVGGRHAPRRGAPRGRGRDAS